ncbi:MAG: sensor domain-containing protein [Bifidobacteriaceae bacterium]|jgi:hypothetical protein|nr:sensor domain-containing protein [Bifidobacteriaceae bacterium]
MTTTPAATPAQQTLDSTPTAPTAPNAPTAPVQQAEGLPDGAPAPSSAAPIPTPKTKADRLALLKGIGLDSAYLLLAFPITLVSFTVLITMLSVGIGLIIVWIGIPLLFATLVVGHWFANLERVRLRARGTDIEQLPPPPPSTDGYFRRFLKSLANPVWWRETLHGLVAFPVATVTWCIAITWWSVVIFGLTGPLWEPLMQRAFDANDVDSTGFMETMNWPIPEWLFYFGAGLLAAITLPFVLRGLAAVHAGLGKALLSPTRGEMAKRIAALSQARDQASAAEAQSLRRLERDLHDGPQQALIRLGMDLSAVERRLAEGDTAAASNCGGAGVVTVG